MCQEEIKEGLFYCLLDPFFMIEVLFDVFTLHIQRHFVRSLNIFDTLYLGSYCLLSPRHCTLYLSPTDPCGCPVIIQLGSILVNLYVIC